MAGFEWRSVITYSSSPSFSIIIIIIISIINEPNNTNYTQIMIIPNNTKQNIIKWKSTTIKL